MYMKYLLRYYPIDFDFANFSFFIPIISIVILILDSQPIFYSQYRVGLNGKEFKLYKFRTMADSV